MGLDDLVDKRARNLASPGEKFEKQFLARRARTQWPVYLDQTAIEIEDGIVQGDTDVDKTNFSPELGPRYRKGMEAATGSGADLSKILSETIADKELGTIIYQLNRLSYEIEGRDSGLENVQEALEAVFEKILTIETGYELSTHSRSDTGTIADIVVEMFSDERIARRANELVDAFEKNLSDGLLAKLDEPQMMTPLWRHQFEGLQAWKDAGYRGYADMATATGKTVLGIAAIALRYGHLHPVDELEGTKESSGRDHVLVVAHSDLIIEQWRREFDRHLNIPRQRTGSADDIELSWGHVHFRTPQALTQQDSFDYDLVILDEAHHYATGKEWGKLLNEFDCDVLALSGSVNDAGTDSKALQSHLREKVGPEIIRYTIAEAQADGVVPAFDWEIRYAPYIVDEQFTSVTRDAEVSYAKFREAVENGEYETERPLRTYDDIRTFAHTTEGKKYKRDDDLFRDLSTALFSRRTRRWNLSPRLDSVVDVVDEHTNDHVVVLADSNAQVGKLVEAITDRYPDVDVFGVHRNQDRSELRDTLDEFDDSEAGGVLVGTGDLLGEGVDIPNARVAVNMATGGVNPQLVQRIGRVLRNPSGDKHAQFYNVVGIPEGDAAVPREDGRRLLTDAAQFCNLGSKFDNLPGFATSSQLNDEVLGELLQAGNREIDSLESLGVDVDTLGGNDFLAELRKRIPESGPCSGDGVLAQWGEYSWLETSGVSDEVSPSTEDTPRPNEVGEETVEAPSRVALNQSIRRLAKSHSKPLTADVLRKEGKFDATIYEEVFGSLEDALRAAGVDVDADEMDERKEIVRSLQEIAVVEEREPKPSDLPYGETTITEVYRLFNDWADAMSEAGVQDGPTEEMVASFNGDDDDDDLERTTNKRGEDDVFEPNELAEIYSTFTELNHLLTSLLESEYTEQAVGDGSPLAIWQATVEKWVTGDGPVGAPSYGEQQSVRNPVSISDYREVYGDGERLITYSIVDTAPLNEAERTLLSEVGVPTDSKWTNLPVAPQTGVRLPIAVVDEGDLGLALLLLSEFPRYPEPASSGDVDVSERLDGDGRIGRLTAEVVSVEIGSDSKRDFDLLLDVDGIGEIDMTVWSEHGLDVNWAPGMRYELHQLHFKTWGSESDPRRKLSSTRDTKAYRLQSRPSREPETEDESSSAGSNSLFGRLRSAIGRQPTTDTGGAGEIPTELPSESLLCQLREVYES
ncbi:DEAD/DEAH box helicase family protein [Halogranum rubrum]|uniref:Uncharacterized protein n=1 Tax=Halogranum salarium B-1 TaxID=1210908 RepID=J3JDV2_9EURY|nr:DEAD/DEAH box helicase family protein [Halogranum salarium]EJN57811.1 hypothetical protein HSB1_38960 [Halogranum salarium B-1]